MAIVFVCVFRRFAFLSRDRINGGRERCVYREGRVVFFRGKFFFFCEVVFKIED